MIVVRWCIPDMKSDLRDQIRREAYITNEIIIRQETLRARAGNFFITLFFSFVKNLYLMS